MVVRNPFQAAGAKDIDSLRRSTNNAFQGLTNAINRENEAQDTAIAAAAATTPTTTTPAAVSGDGRLIYGLGDIVRTAAPATVATLTGLTATTTGAFEFASEANLDTFLQELAVHRPSVGQPFESTRTVVIQVGTTVIGGIPVGARLTITRPRRITFTGITLTRALTTADSVIFLAPNRTNTIVRSITTIPASQRSVSGTTISVTIPSSDTDRFAAAGNIQLIGIARTQVILINREFGNAVYTVSNYVATPTQITYDLNQVVAVDFAGRTQVPFTIPTGDLEAYYCGVEDTNRRFEHLVDTPDAYAGFRGNQLRVNSTETGLEFFPAEFAVDVIRITGTTPGFSLNSDHTLDGDYILQANTGKYLNGAGDAVVTMTTNVGPYFWYNELNDVSLVATGVTGLNENWRIVAGHWINDAVYAENYVVTSPNIGARATAGQFVVVNGNGLLFASIANDDLQVPEGALLQTVVGGGGAAQATSISGFDPTRIDRHFLNRPLIETENGFTIRTDLIGTPENFVFDRGGNLTLPAAPTAANHAATRAYVDSASGNNLVNRTTPTGSITFTQAELNALDVDNPTITRTVTVNSVVVATATVTATVEPMGIGFNHAATLDTLVAGWTFVDATLGTVGLPFTLVLGQDHEWTAGYPGGSATGDLVINVADTSAATGIFYVDSTAGIDSRLDNVGLTTGTIEDLGFQTEEEAAETFVTQDPNDPYVQTSTLAGYVPTANLGVAIGRGTTFPTLPENGDEFFLTENIYPAGTTFNASPTSISSFGTGSGEQVLRTITATDPTSNEELIAGTVYVNQENVAIISSNPAFSLTGGAGRTYNRGFVRDRSFQGRHETRASTVGTTIITTTVSEVQYRDITTVAFGGGPAITLVDATLHDFYYQQVSRNRAGSAIIRSLHYIVIRTPTGDINTYPAQGGAIDAIEGYIQDSSTLWIDLIQGTSTPTTFTSTARLPTGSYSVMGDLGSMREETTYQFIPMNGFTIQIATINSVVQTVGEDGTINIVQNDDARSWIVQFTRLFDNVPTTPTNPDFVPGLYVRQSDGWSRVSYVAAGSTNELEFTTSGTWTKPEGVTEYQVLLIPGGAYSTTLDFYNSLITWDVRGAPSASGTATITVGAAATTENANGGQSRFELAGFGSLRSGFASTTISNVVRLDSSAARGDTNATVSLMSGVADGPYRLSDGTFAGEIGQRDTQTSNGAVIVRW